MDDGWFAIEDKPGACIERNQFGFTYQQYSCNRLLVMSYPFHKLLQKAQSDTLKMTLFDIGKDVQKYHYMSEESNVI